MLNNITVMGRLTHDPELRRTSSGVAVASFSIANEADFKDANGEKKTTFLDCVAWRGTAEFVSKYFFKGKMVIVNGRLDSRVWTDKDGKNRKSIEIVAENVYFGDSKRSDESGSYKYDNQPYQSAEDFAVLDDDDKQLPF